MTIIERVLGRGQESITAPLKEIIGRVSYVTAFWKQFRGHSVDETKTDYAWWDKFRRGKLVGYEFSGLFAKPITEILASWVMGEVIEPRLVDADEYTDNLLQAFFKRIHGKLLTVVIDLYGLGDQYLIVNADGGLSIPSPDLVNIEYDPLDYRKMEKVIITSRFKDVTVTDTYTASEREVAFKWNSKERKDTEVFRFVNLIGKIPIVHLANDRSGNETNGRPIYESLRTLYSRYNDLLNKMIDGAELMGNPIPTWEGMDDISSTIEANATSPASTFLDEDGLEQNETQIDFNNLPAVFVGSGGSFKFASPSAGFTDDIRNTLKSLFILLAEHTRVPEAVWGLELSSARSTAVEQLKTFYMYIVQKRLQLQGLGVDDDLQADAEGGLLELCDIWLRMRALTDTQVVVGAVTLKWSELGQEDAQLQWQKTESAHNKGVLTDRAYLANLDIVEDVDAELDGAEEEMSNEADRFEQDVDEALEGAA